VWQAAFVCVYSTYFPQMDEAHHLIPDGLLSPSPDINVNKTRGLAGLTRKILGGMVPRLRMVRRYLKSIDRMHDYFHDVHRTYCVKFKKRPYPGGGLEQYKLYEKELKEFGDLRDPDQTMASDGSDTVNEVRSRASTNDIPGNSVNGEPMQGVEAAPQRPNGAWAAVNAASPPVETEERPKYGHGHGPYPYGIPYQQSPNQSSTAPSVISASNGDSTPGLNSPYGNIQSQLQQHYHNNPIQQPPHISTYPPVTQHTMAPPNTQPEYTENFDGWIKTYESISMNTGFDNFGQHDPPETWPTFPDANPNPNYMQAVWNPQPQIGTTW